MSTATMPSVFASKAVVAGDGNYEKCPAGNKPGWLIALIDGGTHVELVDRDQKDDQGKVIFGPDGKPKKIQVEADLRKLFFFWQLTNTKDQNGDPFIIGEKYNWSEKLSEKAAARKMIESWRGSGCPDGQPIDPTEMIDVPCLVNVVNKKSGEKILVNVGGITPMIEGMTPPPRTRDPLFYHLSMGEPPDTSFLPYVYGEKVADVIARSKERGGTGMKGSKPAVSQSSPGNQSQGEDDRWNAIQTAERHFQKARLAGTPKAGRDFDAALKLMRDHKIDDAEMSQDCQEQLIPF